MAYAAITKPSLHMNTKLYTGTGASNAITGVGFQPDFTWIKNTDAADFHVLTDAVRGATKYLQSDSDAAEVTNAESLKSFDSDGFTVGTMNEVNTNTEEFVSWNWKGNGAGSSNTDGNNITSTVSANTTAGFSVVKWTGDSDAASTVGHGLGSSGIDWLITKNNDTTNTWYCTTTKLVTGHNIYISATAGQTNTSGSTGGGVADLTASNAFGFIAGSGGVYPNLSGNTITAYCFKSVKGFSTCSAYVGNGNADGPFVYTGFRPAYFFVKSTGVKDWFIIDDKTSPYNVAATWQTSNNNYAGTTNVSQFAVDFLSNGFKIRAADGNLNTDSQEYIFMAFAAEPLVVNVGTSIPGTAN